MKPPDYLRWALRILLALAFLAAGGAKLAGNPVIFASLRHLGYPVWVGYAVGALEVLGALGLLVPRLACGAAAGLTVLMVGATLSHLAAADGLGPSAGLLALLLGLLALNRRWAAAQSRRRGPKLSGGGGAS